MARICHTNNCPVGVTTQKEELRKKFPGTPQNVVTFFEVRYAEFGFRRNFLLGCSGDVCVVGGRFCFVVDARFCVLRQSQQHKSSCDRTMRGVCLLAVATHRR